MQNQSQNITTAFSFLKELIKNRLQFFFNKDNNTDFAYPSLNIKPNGGPLSILINEKELASDEITILLTALVIHAQPYFFEHIIREYLPEGGDFPEIGGIKGNNYRGMLPTGETVQFILAGDNPDKRLHIQDLLSGDSILVKEHILWLDTANEGEPLMSSKLILSADYAEYLISGKMPQPCFGPDFPARKIHTRMEWEDLVLPEVTLARIKDIMIWMHYNPVLIAKEENLAKRIKPGYRILFYGPSGTGKTLTATLLGKHFNKEVYCIDLSQIVSKYIGETEKNLEKVFTKAEHKDWILFFDEADALFGKRSNVQSAHDKYANQETAYLLQRIEDYPGLLILASNFKNNIDTAFSRRFNMVVYFPMPGPKERLLLWEKSLPGGLRVSFDCCSLAEKFEITGAAILNAVHFASLKALANDRNELQLEDIIEGIRHELQKEDKFI